MYNKPKFKIPYGPILLTVSIVIAVLIIGFNSYYQHVQGPMWDAETDAKQRAVGAFFFQEARSATPFAWDENGFVVRGIDEDGDKAVAFLGETTFFAKKVADGVTKTTVENMFAKQHPQGTLLRTQLGLMDKHPVWQVYYSLIVNKQPVYYYNFYRFADGKLVLKYQLAQH